MLLKIKEFQLNLAKVVPLTGGDWRALEKDGVKFGPQTDGNAENIMRLVLFAANKVRRTDFPGNTTGPDLTIEDVDALPIARIVEAAAFIRSEGMEKDDPN